jgi:hypothetical protein
VHDWSSVVRSRLAALGLDGGREDEICAELAEHLEDACADAVRSGCTEEDAVARALEQVPDWTHLANAIHHANQEEGPMSHNARTLWLPGMAALGAAAAVLLSVTWLVPGSAWTDPGARLPMMAAMLLSYLLCGALGAWWSRRAGGSVAARFVAGLFPLALHLSMVLVAAIRVHSDVRPVVALGFIVIPGIALTIGALPFLTSSLPSRPSTS